MASVPLILVPREDTTTQDVYLSVPGSGTILGQVAEHPTPDGTRHQAVSTDGYTATEATRLDALYRLVFHLAPKGAAV